MEQGTVKKIVSEKGFGFIQTNGPDVFFHHSNVVDRGFDNLTNGQLVEFSLDNGDKRKGKGPRASLVRPVAPA